MSVTNAKGAPGVISPNYIINGAFDFWQRGTSFSSAGYTADRFAWINGAATGSISRQTFTPAELEAIGFGGAQFYARWNVTSGEQFTTFTQRIEDVRTLAGQTVTVSFWAKGTNPAAGFWDVNLGQVFGSGGSQDVFTDVQRLTVTNSWARYSFTFTVPSVAGKTIGANSFVRLPNIYQSTASSAAFTLDIWGVQVEAGSVATPFRRNANSLQGELAACQRYYETSAPIGILPTDNNGAFPAIVSNIRSVAGQYQNDGWGTMNYVFSVPKRATPSLAFFGISGSSGNGDIFFGSSTTSNTAPGAVLAPHQFTKAVTASGISSGQAYVLRVQWAASAEL